DNASQANRLSPHTPIACIRDTSDIGRWTGRFISSSVAARPTRIRTRSAVVRSYVIVATTRAGALRLRSGQVRATRAVYFFSEALFAFPPHDEPSPHLRNAGTTNACSSVGSFRLVRVSVVRLAPALY